MHQALGNYFNTKWLISFPQEAYNLVQGSANYGP